MNNIGKTLYLIKNGAPIAGAAVGGAVGFMTGGPGGAALGGALGVALAHGVEEAADRARSQREKGRGGATASHAMEFVRQRLAAGDIPRGEGFFRNLEVRTTATADVCDGGLIR